MGPVKTRMITSNMYSIFCNHNMVHKLKISIYSLWQVIGSLYFYFLWQAPSQAQFSIFKYLPWLAQFSLFIYSIWQAQFSKSIYSHMTNSVLCIDIFSMKKVFPFHYVFLWHELSRFSIFLSFLWKAEFSIFIYVFYAMSSFLC